MSIIEFSAPIDDAVAPTPLPEGTYPAEIIRAEEKTSANSGNNFLSIQFRISADRYPADYTEGDEDGTVLPYNRLILRDDAASRYRLKRFSDAVGITIGTSFDPDSLIGLAANVAVKNSEYEGEPRAEIAKIVAAD